MLIGSNVRDISFSSNALKHMEFDRLKATHRVLSKPTIPTIDEEEMHATIDGHLLSHFVGEVAEIDSDDESGLGSLFELKASGRKSKASSCKYNKRSSKRANVSKTPIVSQ